MSKATYYHIAGGKLVEGTALGRITVVLGANFDTLAEAYVRAGEREHALRVELHAAKQKNDALQERLTVADQRADDLEGLLREIRFKEDGHGFRVCSIGSYYSKKIEAALSASAEPKCSKCGDSGVIDDKGIDELPGGHFTERGLVACPDCEELSAPKCKTCHGVGEVYTGKMADQGWHQPPEPIMAECPDCKWGAPVERDEQQRFAQWTHEVVEFEHRGITRKIQRRDLMDLEAEKNAWAGWQARASLDKATEGGAHEK